jgi:hypothetical protein
MKGFMLDEDRDLLIENGEVVVGDVGGQNLEMLIVAEKGEIREAPLRGVGMRRYIDDEDPATLLQAIRNEIATEGMVLEKLEITADGKLDIEAKYK